MLTTQTLSLVRAESVRVLICQSEPHSHLQSCEAEKETLAFVLGSCPKGSLQRNARRSQVRTKIADAFRRKAGHKVLEEVPCIGTDKTSRRIDIIIIDRGKKQAWISGSSNTI